MKRVCILVFLLLALTACEDGPRLTSERVELPDGRSVVCVREVGVNTRLDCDWATAH